MVNKMMIVLLALLAVACKEEAVEAAPVEEVTPALAEVLPVETVE